jgi:cyanophycin synthetase
MADLAQRLDVQGRRIIVLSAPGDRRDEDIVAIAETVAGKFDHYICRRDDSLRGRDGDEIPGMLAKVLRAKGVADAAISIIPDEQKAIDAALHMGAQGDLLLIFADALTRSWKQVTKFRPAGAEQIAGAADAKKDAARDAESDSQRGAGLNEAALESAGFVRDERGLRFVKESDD